MATKRKTTSGYRISGGGSNLTWDQSVLSPKNASPNKYGTMATPKSRPRERWEDYTVKDATFEAKTATPRKPKKAKSAVEIRKSNVKKANKTSK